MIRGRQEVPERGSWPDGHKAAVVFNVAYEAWAEGVAPGISPMGNPLPAGHFDTQAADWAQYGWKSGIWRLLDVLTRHDVRATVFTSACLAERAPDSIRALADAGHDVCGHSYAQNILPIMLSADEEREHIARCRELLEGLLGKSLRGWISPRGTPSENTRALLAQAGFKWHGDCFDRDHASVEVFGEKRIVALPLMMEVNDLPIYMRHGNPPRAFYDTFDDVFAAALDDPTAGQVDVTVHTHVFGRPHGARIYEKIIRRVMSRADVWVTTKSELSAWILEREASTI